MLQLALQTPSKSLNLAFRKSAVTRSDIEAFKSGLKNLFDQSREGLSEETLKSLLHTLLSKHHYEPEYHISVNNNRQDMSIHLGKKFEHAVGVIIETKTIGSAEMLTAQKPNTRAFHELVLYYLRERITNGNIEIKHLVATDIFNWIIFDANEFEKKILGNTAIKKLFDIHKADEKRNDFFYNELKAMLDRSDITLQATSFSLNTYKKATLNTAKEDDKSMLPLYKILSPAHLLKLPVANDSNSLDKGFYSELLHIIGLEEVTNKGKKLIQRRQPLQRHEASLLENALLKLQDKEALRNLDQSQRQGDTSEAQYFNLALELCIIWVNRILFMKLLEAQLLGYHNGSKDYRFMSKALVHDFDELNNLFFLVLAELPGKRREWLQQKFSAVPYLNSSLFERTEIERRTIDISSLDNQLRLPLSSTTVLKDDKGKRRSGSITTLEYLFEFLDAYKFSSDSSNEIQEDNKTLINASVLGLIFEKINGYKDGSFFTPGFITMYMCRQTIREAVVQKFNTVKGWHCKSLDDLYDQILPEQRNEANAIVNSLHICDPAVGSGHFLVSALNELIAVKQDLRILQDRQGRRLKEYHISVANDELFIADEDGEPFVYKPGHPEKQRVQETLFHEKQTLIENCLFGVDINPNSVKICRLRLWIELLKHTYYKSGSGALETLPNIDINIKTGNSLVSRFSLDASLAEALKNSKWNINSYQLAVRQYKRAQTKTEKRELEELIDKISNDFKTSLSFRDREAKGLVKLRGTVTKLATEIANLSAFGQAVPKKLFTDLEKATKERDKAEEKVVKIEEGKFFNNAFEWRIAFPEVLNDDGDFMGFDVIIGNPPYIRQEEISWMKPYLQKQFATYAGTADMYVFFVEKGMQLLQQNGLFCYILPNKWMKGGYGKPLRQWAAQKQTLQMIDFGDLPVFEEATTYPSIWMMQNKAPEKPGFTAAVANTLDYPEGMEQYLQSQWLQVSAESLTAESWNLVDSRKQQLLDKIKAAGKPLGEYVNGKIYRGVLTGLNEAFVIDKATREQLIAADPHCADIIKPFLAGKDIKRYQQPVSDKWLILFPCGFTAKQFGRLTETEAWEKLCALYPALSKQLLPHKEKATARWDKGDYWWELRPCDYYSEFEKPKILYQEIAAYSTFAYDTKGIFTNNKLFLIPTENFALLGFLNSKLVWFCLKHSANILRGALALQSPYILSLSVAHHLLNNEQLQSLSQQVYLQKQQHAAADTSALKQAIDAIVYAAYGLSEEEVGMVEGR